jgi:hypothetical protein
MDGHLKVKGAAAVGADVARTAGGGATEAAGGIGNVVVKAVKEMLIGVAEGVKEIGSAVFQSRGSRQDKLSHLPTMLILLINEKRER